jgi:hypothetical protein
MPTPAQNSQLRNAEMGFRVQGAAKTVPQAATSTIFTVSGGRISVGLLYGVVTTVIGGTTPSAKLVATPTVGTANDMCTAVAITASEVGTQMACPLATGSALIVVISKSGSVSGPGLGGQIVAPGTIGVNVSAADATGAIQWTLFYVPLDPASVVVAN